MIELFPQADHMKKQGLVYLDSAATTLKHQAYLDTAYKFESQDVANVHRGAHRLSSLATQRFEETRLSASSFLNCSINQIAFTSGTTDSVNLVAHSLKIKKNENILVTQMEHHANLLPWQRLAQQAKVQIVAAPLNPDGDLNLEATENLFRKHNIKIFAFPHMSNTLGTLNDVKKLSALAKEHGALCFVDGAQGVTVEQPSFKNWNHVDFYTFSAHKAFGPFGLGILYAKNLDALDPYKLGGAIVDEVSFEKASFLTGPQKLEPGTPNVTATIAFKPVLDFLNQMDYKKVTSHEKQLLTTAQAELSKLKGFKEVGTSKTKINILSFNFQGVQAHDLCELLDEQGLALRSGHHCTQPLIHSLGLKSAARASFSIYNTPEDVERFVESTKKALTLLRGL